MTTELLEALARLVTGQVGREGWSPAVSAVLDRIPPDGLRRYSASLLDKRTAELRWAIPVTAAASPPVLGAYRTWLARNPAPAVDRVLPPGLHEALRASAVVAAAIDVDWLQEVFAFEVCRAASRRDHVERFLNARYPAHTLFQLLSDGEIPLDPDPAPHRYRFGDRVEWRTR